MRGRRIFRRSRNRSLIPTILLLLASTVLILILSSLSKKSATEKLLFMTPRSGGFNNQLITIYEAIHCAQKHDRTAVLPLIYENVRADTTTKGDGPFPFEDYFDLEQLEKIVKLTTPARLDVERLPCDTIYFATSGHFKANARRIPRLLKQQYVKRYPVNLSFVDDFQKLARYKCVDDSLCDKPDVFGAYSDYKVNGQGYNIRESRVLLDIRAAFKPSHVVRVIADHVMNGIGTRYNAMHIRRGDFSTKCDELPAMCDQFGNDSFVQSSDCLLQKADSMAEKLPLFVSTTHGEECRRIFANSGVKVVFMDDIGVPKGVEWALERIDIISFASQVVASEASQFIGNRFSSYTSEINNMRYLRDPADVPIFF